MGRAGVGSGIGLAVNYRYRFAVVQRQPGQAPRAIKWPELLSTEFRPVFPALFKLYDTTAFGTARIRNMEKKPLTDLTVDFFAASYMDNPTRVQAGATLEGGAELEIPLKALFSEQVLRITEATKASAKLTVSFTFDGQPYARDSRRRSR